jgi:hypothetical protein
MRAAAPSGAHVQPLVLFVRLRRGEIRVSETIRQPTAAPPPPTAPTEEVSDRAPTRGDRVERTRNGVTRRGRVFYADHLQVLVKWDDGSSSSLRVDKGEFSAIRVSARPRPPHTR